MPVLQNTYDRQYTDWFPERVKKFTGGSLLIFKDGKIIKIVELESDRVSELMAILEVKSK